MECIYADFASEYTLAKADLFAYKSIKRLVHQLKIKNAADYIK